MSVSRRTLGFLLLGALVAQTYLLYFWPAGNGDSAFPPGSDKMVHACMFGVPALILAMLRKRWALALLALYAPLSEVLQTQVGRDGDWRDVVADLTGILLLGLWIGSRARR